MKISDTVEMKGSPVEGYYLECGSFSAFLSYNCRRAWERATHCARVYRRAMSAIAEIHADCSGYTVSVMNLYDDTISLWLEWPEGGSQTLVFENALLSKEQWHS